MNCDVLSRKFVYWIPMLESGLLERLRMRNGYDVLDNTFDEENSLIIFQKNGTTLTYRLRIEAQEGGCLLKLEQMTPIAPGYILKDISPFWKQKFAAVPVEYCAQTF